jgi:hypothetical protein
MAQFVQPIRREMGERGAAIPPSIEPEHTGHDGTTLIE